MNPHVRFGRGDSGRFTVASKFDGNVAGLLPLPAFAFDLDLAADKNLREPPFINQRLAELKIELAVVIERDLAVERHGRSPPQWPKAHHGAPLTAERASGNQANESTAASCWVAFR